MARKEHIPTTRISETIYERHYGKCVPPDILTNRLMDDRLPEQIVDVIDSLCEKNGNDNYTAILILIVS